MIIESILNLLKSIIITVFSVLPNIPTLDIQSTIEEYFSLIFDNVGLIGIFIRINTLKLLIPVVIVIMNFEHIYKLTLWILKKIPMFGIE